MRYLSILTAILIFVSPLSIQAQWTIHNSYHKLTDAIVCGHLVYGLYESGSLLSYDKQNSEVRFADKTTGLSCTHIVLMDYSTAQHILVLVYDDGNIDLLNTQSGKLTNLPQYAQNQEAGLSLNNLWAEADEALLCTHQGVIRLRLSDASIQGYYRIGHTKAAHISQGNIYAKRQDGTIVTCALSTNLLDLSNWQQTSLTTLPGKTRDNSEAKALLNANLTTYGPESNYCYNMHWTGEQLMIAAGRVDANDLIHRPLCVMTYNGQKWTSFSSDYSKDPHPLQAQWYRDASDVMPVPGQPDRTYVTTGGIGLLEYEKGKLRTRYGSLNSPLKSLIPNNDRYVRVSALCADAQGNTWMANVGTDSVLVCRRANGTWRKYYFKELEGCTEMEHMVLDQEGRLWMADYRWAGNHRGGLFCYDPQTGKNRFRSSFTNQDGTSYSVGAVLCVATDLDGAVWVGTDQGLFVVPEPSEWFSEEFLIQQIKVPRNDGTNFADYLLSGVTITSIAIDGANRKWIGTSDNGLYLVSADGLETLHHFRAENTPLLSNYIFSIAIDDRNGEVYIGTDKGLCSFAGGATAGASTLQKSNLHIFPNPLRPEHPRQITIQGLTQDTDVRIATLGGQVVNHGTSLGGTYQWDTTDLSGNPCASGVYLVLTSTADGRTTVAGRLSIVR